MADTSSASARPQRPQWGSTLGFILAAAGSAIGLGSIWRFPWYVGEQGGAAFVFIYLLCMLVLALPMQWLELALGRATGRNPVGAYAAAAGSPRSAWRLAGFLGILVGIVILSYYTVVAGWTTAYVVLTIGGDVMNPAVPASEIFTRFTANPWQQIGWLVFFMALTAAVVIGGVQKGIERASVVLMPVLVVLILLLIVRALTLPQAGTGLRFYLVPDFGRVTPTTVILAIGQAFYAMSLGIGAMLTYGSYLDKQVDLPKSGAQVALFVSVIALLTGLIVFPAVGGAPAVSGPGLVFMVLVDVFRQLPFGAGVALAFFVLLAIAALTSTISILEVMVAYLVDERRWSRRAATLAMAAVTTVVGIPSALALGANDSLSRLMTLGGHVRSFLDVADFIFGNLLLMLGVLLLAVFAGVRWGLHNAEAELARNSPLFARLRLPWRFSVRVLVPLAIIVILGYLVASGQAI